MLAGQDHATGETLNELAGIPLTSETQERPYYASRRRRKKSDTIVDQVHSKAAVKQIADEGEKLHEHDAPGFLNEDEREIWNETIESAPFLVFADRWTLAQFCKTAILLRKSSKVLEDLFDGTNDVAELVAKTAKDMYRHVSYDYSRLQIMLGLTPGSRKVSDEQKVPDNGSGHFND